QAMRYLDNVKAEIDGGRKISIQMPKPSADFQDVRVLAFPTPENSVPSLRIKATGIQGNEQYAVDINPDTEVFFDDSGRAVFDISADTDFALRSIEIAPAYRPLRAEASLEVKEGDRYRQIAAFTVDRSNPNVEVGWAPFAPIAISVPTTVGKEFRLSITGAGKDSGIKDIIFSSVPRVERYAEKTLSKMFQSPLPYWEEYQWRMQPEADDSPGALAAEQIIDISNCLKDDSLVWNAPDGRWTIMRTGMRPTGITNGPAAAEGTGLEVDKLTSAYLQHHFDSFIGEILRRIPPEDRKTFRVVVADSYEKGGQNFSDTFIADFTQRYGYDPLSYLPVYDGIVVGSRDISDRFLWDMRRFVADRLAYAHIGGMREIAHKHGLTLWLENYGHWGFPGEFLQYGGQSDEVSGEYWSEGTLGDIENRAASSCAHIYGKTKVSAESFTAAGNDFGRYPALMKQRGDRFFAEGINNTLLHVNIAQPSDTVPGMNAWFGNEFNRNNTWFSQIDLFTSYLKRCNYMLQQGLNVADAAYFIGEDAPKMTGTTDPALPRGYQFDYINGEVLLDHMTVKDGKW
ncbi:MAG: glycoside hydrolase family 2, partial [Muribaculaceae bacterium]|nr:glycoside hydrolase family 2 [Muribaculaceae bacterium]